MSNGFYKFSSYAGSRYPLQIWQYRHGKMIDATRRYPQQVKNHAYQLWQEYIKNDELKYRVKFAFNPNKINKIESYL